MIMVSICGNAVAIVQLRYSSRAVFVYSNITSQNE